jgi:hypothetical protein
LFRHLIQFGIENRALFAPGCLHHGIDPGLDQDPFFVFASPGGVRPRELSAAASECLPLLRGPKCRILAKQE